MSIYTDVLGLKKETITKITREFHGVWNYSFYIWMFFFNQRAKKQGQLEKRSFDKLTNN
jgi:hypothetical protein